MVSLKSPAALEVALPHGAAEGGSQMWYGSVWGRKAGCGPVAGSNIIWYLARTRPELADLWKTGGGDKLRFVSLMDEMFTFITPGMRGVNTTDMFREGMEGLWESRGREAEVRTLEWPKNRDERPTIAQAGQFVAGALAEDCPVAFLNLDNGRVHNLERWHWVTLAALNPQTLEAEMLDQGRRVPIDLGLWLRTTGQGGGFVSVRAKI